MFGNSVNNDPDVPVKLAPVVSYPQQKCGHQIKQTGDNALSISWIPK
jgi:hypothetical protein